MKNRNLYVQKLTLAKERVDHLKELVNALRDRIQSEKEKYALLNDNYIKLQSRLVNVLYVLDKHGIKDHL